MQMTVCDVHAAVYMLMRRLLLLSQPPNARDPWSFCARMESVSIAPRCVTLSRTARTDQMSPRKSAVRGLLLHTVTWLDSPDNTLLLMMQVKFIALCLACFWRVSAQLLLQPCALRQHAYAHQHNRLKQLMQQPDNVCHNKMHLPPFY